MSREMSLKLMRYPEAKFGDFSDQDGAIRFYTRVNALLEHEFTVLDIGCGRGACAHDPVRYRRELRILRGKCRRVIGIDVDPAGRENPFLDEFRLIDGDRWPAENESIDLAVSDYVLEHVLDPDRFFSECARVLKAGGMLCLRTPNRYGYVALISRCVPNRFHAAVLRRIGKDRGAEDVFPTVYRCNTAGKIRQMMRRHGFEACVASHEDEPTYLCFSRIAYTLGDFCRRLIPPLFRGNLFAFGRKEAGSCSVERRAA
jgi:SAM-dependent methyltransferase